MIVEVKPIGYRNTNENETKHDDDNDAAHAIEQSMPKSNSTKDQSAILERFLKLKESILAHVEEMEQLVEALEYSDTNSTEHGEVEREEFEESIN